jgi:uncharacterized membrane protein YeaQ/YmgE (transglycosylase-associated protein family)
MFRYIRAFQEVIFAQFKITLSNLLYSKKITLLQCIIQQKLSLSFLPKLIGMTNLLISILIGALAGWLADKAFSRFSLSLWLQIVLGIVGGFVGGWVLGNDLEAVLGLPSIVSRILTSFIGAVIVLGVTALIKGKKTA